MRKPRKQRRWTPWRRNTCAREDYMLDARDFGVRVAGDFYDKYISQGSWTKCLDCLRKTSIDTTSKTTQTNQPEAFACRRRIRSCNSQV